MAAGDNRKQKKIFRDGMFYEMQLNGPAPDRMAFSLDDPYKADPERGEELIAQYLEALSADDDGSMEAEGFVAPWLAAEEDTVWARRLQEFSWLRELRGAGDDAREPARALALGWLTQHGIYEPEVWAPDLVAERLWAMCSHGGWLMEGADAVWRGKFLTSMARQARHLSKSVSRIDHPGSRLVAAMSLIAAGLILPYHRPCEQQGAELLRRELRLQLRADGGHISRNPSFQLMLALRLQIIIAAYEQKDLAPPNFLYHAVGRTTDMVEFFRCGDGRLAVFNGSYEDDARALAACLAHDASNRSRIDFASQSGYQRLSGARTYLFVDTGSRGRQIQTRPLIAGDPVTPYDSAFSIQLSDGRERIIVNCGSIETFAANEPRMTPDKLKAWHGAVSGADAHSTLCVQTAHRIGGAANQTQGRPLYHHLEEDRHGQLLELERQQVAGAPGATHRRRLYLSVDGDDLRGEDVLIAAGGHRVPPFVIRFHLHPGIKASLSRDGRSVILVTPRNEGWTFLAGKADISIEKSLYCGAGGRKQATSQLVVRPRAGGDNATQIKWAFRKASI
ncbi:hypothetical protein FF098_011345 [Parvularcula flava]|uniref:Heparinase n=1 Tax=Aquisalinus luteolus TaxID=1566827 RepID=A0A8J3A2R6_9PROT|nr:heparinase II/III family protein [Aquisalinus luteolus]NHK28502.1 hypothetical protein [Aquisalinus luteolus]GGH98670.1 heparinase [Aquisalinus luteolus]